MKIHVRIYGRVQGVGYRAWTVHRALQLGIFGFVRNRRDRSVEVYAEGEADVLTCFLSDCRQGPCLARVDEIRPVSYPDAPMPQIQREFKMYPTV